MPGANSTFSLVYFVCKEKIDKVVAEGFNAVEKVRHMKALANKEVSENNSLYHKVIESLDYEENLLETFAWYRKSFLSYYRWLDRGDKSFYREWSLTHQKYKEKKKEHLAMYENNLDFPAYNFFAADHGMTHMQRNYTMAMVSRVTLILTFCLFLAGTLFVQKRMRPFPGKNGLRALFISLFTPCDLKYYAQFTFTDIITFCFLPFVLIAAGVLTFSSFYSLTFALWIIGSLVVFFAALIIIHPGNTLMETLTLSGSVLGALSCMNALHLSVVSIRGPLYFWYHFWTNSIFRTYFIFSGFVIAFLVFIIFFTASREILGLSVRSTVGKLLISCGSLIFFTGLAITHIGFERLLTNLNNEMAVFPLVLSKSLGMTTHLNINPSLPLYGVLGGISIAVLGWAIVKISSKNKLFR